MGNKIERLTDIPGINVQSNGEAERLLGATESLLDLRKKRIEWWRNAPEKVIKYQGNNAIDKDGNTYWYSPGSRLIIGDEAKGEAIEVMDTCETPWAFLTVDKAFEELGSISREVKVFERGFGMGITARRVIQQLVIRGGTYTAVELNIGDATYARTEWRPKQLSALTSMASGIPRTKPNIGIEIIGGEAYEETAKLAGAGRKFDIIISDTFPLSEDEQGMNDLLDLDILKQCLEPGGIFAFFAYFPGSTDDVANKQLNMVLKHFKDYRVSRVEINPPPDYKYLQTDAGPVRTLPVVICKNSIL